MLHRQTPASKVKNQVPEDPRMLPQAHGLTLIQSPGAIRLNSDSSVELSNGVAKNDAEKRGCFGRIIKGI